MHLRKTAILLTLLLSHVWAQSMPKELEGIESVSQEPGFYELGVYNKTRTQFDGVTSEEKVNYLRMNRETGVKIPLMTTGETGNSTDFTVMLWFKFQPFEGQDLMQLFSFDESAACFLTQTLSVMCDNGDRRKLSVTTEHLKPGLWFHLTLSVDQAGEKSYLLLQNNNNGVLAMDVNEPEAGPFVFVQNVPSRWQACLGDCSGSFGLVGGIREVVMRNSFIEQADAAKAKNMQFTYGPDFKAYFRFQDNGRFDRDEFVDRTWVSFKPSTFAQTDLIGLDLIPNDICLTTHDQKAYLQFEAQRLFDGIVLSQPLERDNYEYSFSMTFMATGTSCFTKNPYAAVKYCNVFLVEEVFMVYFENINMMKVYFFASKNYYESASKAFFVPMNQWVTLQLSIVRFNGFELVLADQNGLIIYRQTESNRNMYDMLPRNTVSMFSDFNGYVDKVLLCTKQLRIGDTRVKTNYKERDCLFNLSFDLDNISKSGSIKNAGTEPDLTTLGKYKTEEVFYHGVNADPYSGSFLAKSSFDGIACNDGHMTLRLDGKDSYFRFNTPKFGQWQEQSTIEFWFKLSNKKAFASSEKFYLLTTRDVEGKYPYYEIYVQNGILHCAPFGSASINDVQLSFKQFSLENEDQFGWWHVSCSYSFQQLTRATLFNTKVNAYQNQSLEKSSSFYPQDSLLLSFGAPTFSSPAQKIEGLLIKEVRYWSTQRTQDEIGQTRYKQIDPTLSGNQLLSYLRLASGTLDFNNLSQLGSAQKNETKFESSGLSLNPEFQESKTYSYDAVLGKVVENQERTYHTVCPLYTYYLDKYCYSQPINKLVLTIFPQWNKSTKELEWELSVMESAAIETAIILSLKVQWRTNDSILRKFLDQNSGQFTLVVPDKYLRHESECDLSVSLSNEQQTFTEIVTHKFVPSKCNWYTVRDGNSKSTYKVYGSPGMKDISFELQKKVNPEVNCNDFAFFTKVDSLDFEWLLRDTNEFIQFQPDVKFSVSDTGDIVVTIPAAQQVKLPLFKDIQILITVRWRNDDFAVAQNDQVFQHAMVTIKFEPANSSLVASLIASNTDLTRDETLILDASGSYISNVPANMKTRGISYEWQCPTEFIKLCTGQTQSQLAIPFSALTDYQRLNPTALLFNRNFKFTVVVVWERPNTSDLSLKKLSVEVKFWDIKTPNFEISYSPQPVLLTDVKDTVFSLTQANFDVNNLGDYEVRWEVFPQLVDYNWSTTLRNGALFQVDKGSWEANTEYTVTATITHKQLTNLRLEKAVTFETKSPPRDGFVVVSPKSAQLGQVVTIRLDGWVSDNPPIVFNVYKTLDTDGLRRGLLLNSGAPVSAADTFKFMLLNTNPIQVEVTDQSQETVQLIESIQIVDQVAAKSENLTPDELLLRLRKSTDATEKVTLIDQVLEKSLEETPNQTKQTFLLDTSSQITIRMSLIQAFDDQVQIYKREPSTQDMTVEDFIRKTIPLIKSAVSIPSFLDSKLAKLVTSVMDDLSTLKQGILQDLIQTDGQLRDDYIGILQNLNAYARARPDSEVKAWIEDRVNSMMNQICQSQVQFKSPSSSEIEFSLQQFDKDAAMENRKQTLIAIDSQFEFSAFDLFSKFPRTQQPGRLCVQVLAVNGQQYSSSGRRLEASDDVVQYSSAITSVSVLEVESMEKHSLGELTGSLALSFRVMPDSYKLNQTVCMGYSKQTQSWDAELCHSELLVSDVQMKCTCNAFKSDLTGLFTDFRRPLSTEVIEFPEIEVLSESNSGKSAHLYTKSYVWLISTSGLAVVLLVSIGIAFKLDAKDRLKQLQQQNRPIQNMEVSFGSASSGMNHFVLEVSRELHQPYAEVEFRRANLAAYRNICPNSVFIHCLAQMHPLVAPFISTFATQSRLLRLSAYVLQINIFEACTCYYFNETYRLTAIRYDDSVIDQTDLQRIALASLIGSFCLLPFISEPICTLLSNTLTRVVSQDATYMDEIQVQVKSRRTIPRVIVYLLAIGTTVAGPIYAALQPKAQSANQYCIFLTMFGSLIGSIFTNALYVAYNSTLARLMIRNKFGRVTGSSWLVCHKALTIAQDMQAVQEASKLFTLGDVLPASLESIRTIQNKQTDPDKEHSEEEISCDPTHRGSKFIESGSMSKEDSMQQLAQARSHQVYSRKARMIRAEQRVDINEIDPNSLTYTEYKARIGVSVEKGARQNNYITVQHNNSSDQDQSHETSVACNEQIKQSEHESSQAQFVINSRSRFDELSHQLTQNYSRPDISRNEILPEKTEKQFGSESNQSDFSDIRKDGSSSQSSANFEVRVQPEQKPGRRL